MSSGSTERSIFVKYRKILLAVILFMVADSIVIGTSIYGTYLANESAVSINLSGRQRMLSQRTTKALLLLQRAYTARDEERVVTQLKELELAVGLFDTTLHGFQNGDRVTGGDGNPAYLPAVSTDSGQQIVADAYALWTPYLKLLEPLRHEKRNFTASQLEAAVTYAQANNLQILKLMNDLTTDLEVSANQHAARLRWVLFIGMIVAILNFGYTVFISLTDLVAKDAEVDKARHETEEILNTVHEGLFLLDKDKRFGSQYSATLPNMLHTGIEGGMEFMPVLQRMMATPELFEAASDYIELLLGERVKESLVASLNPLVNLPVKLHDAAGREQERFLSFFFNRVLDEEQKVRHLLVTVQDVTDKVLLLRQLEEAKGKARAEMENILGLLSGDFEGLRGFVGRVGESLTQINSALSQTEESPQGRLRTLNYVLRSVHTLKGEAAMLGIDVFESYAHACEQEMVAMRDSDKGVTADNMLRLTVLLEGFYERYTTLADIVQRFGEGMSGGGGQLATPELAQPLAEHLTHLAQRIASDEQKEVAVECDLEAIAGIGQERASALQSMCIQLVRNAVAHGIETPGARKAKGKSPIGELTIRCASKDGLIDFMVRDDGAGIVPALLRERFTQNGMLTKIEADAMSDIEIAQLIFKPGVSSKAGADRDAGHGVGLDIVLDKVQRMGGQLQVKSRPDEYTEFHIRFGRIR
ncbi:MAG: type IV pili methyl-accepting chemotaxis transducer N-terminal domain-containing protein [Zoogloeaceae bacterium]|jgi:signal transduction histidine kinase|nr:type IV pili methyl-accepting chemotaxis transducer N-terminal domain-containing protein [Zoogloeaceae bacterium]